MDTADVEDISVSVSRCAGRNIDSVLFDYHTLTRQLLL